MYLLKGFQLFIHFSSVLKQLPGDKNWRVHTKTQFAYRNKPVATCRHYIMYVLLIVTVKKSGQSLFICNEVPAWKYTGFDK